MGAGGARQDVDLDSRAFLGICYPSRRLSRNAKRLFMPASTTKLYTSYLACESLGEDHAFRSEYSVQGRTLFLKPMGHPLLDETSFRGLLEDVGGRPIDEIVFCPHFRDLQPYPSTWALGDVREAWGAPISEVCFHENFATLGGPKGLEIHPSSSYFETRIREGLKQPRVQGRVVSVPRGYEGTFEFPVVDPVGFLFLWLRERLGGRPMKKRVGRMRGIPVSFARTALKKVLRVMNKKSSNILAELLLVHASQGLGKPMDYERPAAAFAEVLAGIRVRDALLWDGSGVSRYNLVSPSGTVALLEASKRYASIRDSLPVGGQDGTLAGRKLPRRIRAKTGSLTGVQALAGYDGDEPFAIYVNHGPPDEASMIEAIDRIVRGR